MPKHAETFSMRKLISRLYDLPNAFRVLDIMDEAGCDIEQVSDRCWAINTKWWVSKEAAEDLRTIILHKRQYRERSRLWKKLFFPTFREGSRVLRFWV